MEVSNERWRHANGSAAGFEQGNCTRTPSLAASNVELSPSAKKGGEDVSAVRPQKGAAGLGQQVALGHWQPVCEARASIG